MPKSLPSPKRLPAAQGFGRRGFAQAGKCQMNVKAQTQIFNIGNLDFVWYLNFVI